MKKMQTNTKIANAMNTAGSASLILDALTPEELYRKKLAKLANQTSLDEALDNPTPLPPIAASDESFGVTNGWNKIDLQAASEEK